MRFRHFKRDVLDDLNTYFSRIEKKFGSDLGRLGIIFPQFISFSETEHHYSYELFGVSRRPTQLISSERSIENTDQLFDPLYSPQRTSGGLVLRGSGNLRFQGFAFSRGQREKALEKRFPIIAAFAHRQH